MPRAADAVQLLECSGYWPVTIDFRRAPASACAEVTMTSRTAIVPTAAAHKDFIFRYTTFIV